MGVDGWSTSRPGRFTLRKDPVPIVLCENMFAPLKFAVQVRVSCACIVVTTWRTSFLRANRIQNSQTLICVLCQMRLIRNVASFILIFSVHPPLSFQTYTIAIIFSPTDNIHQFLFSPMHSTSSSSSSYICHGVGPLVDPFRSHVSRSLFKGLPWFLLPVGE